MTTATVRLWGTPIGYVSMDHGEPFARFEYDPVFAAAGIEVAPLQMPVQPRRIHQFRDLDPRSFHGLPGLLADSLPDKYGNRLIDAWLARKGQQPKVVVEVLLLHRGLHRLVTHLCAESIRPSGLQGLMH